MKKTLFLSLFIGLFIFQEELKSEENQFFILNFMGYVNKLSEDGRYAVGKGSGMGFIFDTETVQIDTHPLMHNATDVTNDKTVLGNFHYNNYQIGETYKDVTIGGIWEDGEWVPLNIGNLTANDIVNNEDGSYAHAFSTDKKTVGGMLSRSSMAFVDPCVWTKNEDGTWNCQVYSTPDNTGHPIYKNGRINAISGDGSICVGWTSNNSGGRVPTIWKSPTEYILAESTGSETRECVSKNGKYAGFSANGKAVIYHVIEERFEEIPTHPGANSARLVGISDDGIAVGYSNFGSISVGWRFGFVYSPVLGFFDMADYIETFAPELDISPLDFRGNYLTDPMDISNDGKTIAGWWGTSSMHQVPWILKLAENPVILNKPQNVHVSVENHKTVTLTWETPETMIGYTLTGYNIYRNYELLASTNSNDTEYIYDDLEEGTHFLTVAAVYGNKMSPKTDFFYIEIYSMDLPFFEDFETDKITTNFWTIDPVSSNAPWRIILGNFRGLVWSGITFLSSHASPQESYSFISKELEASETENVYLKFALKYDFASPNSSQEVLYVEVLTDAEWETAATFSKADLNPGESIFGWNVQTIDLTNFASGKKFHIRFRVHCSKNEYNEIDIDNIRVDIAPFSQIMNVPSKPEAEFVNNNTVDIKWKTPKNSYDLSYINGIPFTAIGDEGVEFIAVNSFNADKLIPFTGKYLSSITAHITQIYYDTPAHELSLVIFYGDKKIEQPIAGYLPNSWNTFILENPLLLDAELNLKFGIKVISHHPYELVISTDKSNSINREGNLFSEDDGVTWHRLYDEGINDNLAIIGDITDTDSDYNYMEIDKNFIGYIVHRNSQPISKKLIYQTNYRDTGINEEFPITYNLSAYYKNGMESELSETFILNQTSILKPDNYQINIAPNPVNDFINIKGDFTKATLIDISGKVIFETKEHTISVSGLPEGIYLLKIESGSQVTVCKIVKNFP